MINTKLATISMMVFAVAMIGVSSTMMSASATSNLVVNGTNYYQTTSETVDVIFTQSDGGDTLETYSGLVLLTVSGVGESNYIMDNDAFYIFEDANGNSITPVHQGALFQLAYDASHLVGGSGVVTPPALAAKQSIVFDVDAGTDTTPTHLPAYRSDHTYTFVVNTELETPSVLHFGVIDDYFVGNSGAYNIEVTQLSEKKSCVALNDAEDNGNGKYTGIPKAKANNGC